MVFSGVVSIVSFGCMSHPFGNLRCTDPITSRWRREEKEREGQMALDRQYETTIERQRERQRVIDIYGERETDRDRERETDRETNRETEREREETVQINYI